MTSPNHPDERVAIPWPFLAAGLALLAMLALFLVWRATRAPASLSSAQMENDLTHINHPQQTQHALSLVAGAMIRGDKSVDRWYPDVARLASCPVPGIRETAAWVMGQGTAVPRFHEILLKLLHDPETLVRMNAALALVRFHDASGHAEIIRMLTGEPLLAPESGRLKRLLNVGQRVQTNTLVARIIRGKKGMNVVAGVPGSLARWTAAGGATVAAGDPVAVLAPTSSMVRKALRALYLIGQPGDLNAIAPYTHGLPGMSAEVTEQARYTTQEIRDRGRSGS